MSDEIIFREVDEELRRDRVQTAWRRYGPFVIGACVAIIAIVAAEEGWSWWQGSNAARSSDQFYAALDAENNGDIPGAMKALDAVIAQGSGQYPVLARFKEAGLLAKQGKADDALKAFDDLATTVSNTRLKELALLSGANLLVDKGDVPGVKQRVTGLLASDNPLRNSARETLGLAQYKSGDLAGALDSFEAILNDPISSQETRGRIQVYIGQLAAEGVSPPAADAAAAGAAAVNAASGAAASAPAATQSPSAGGEAPASAATDSSAPAGISASQPMTPDSAVQFAVPPAPATPAPTSDAQPALSTGLPQVGTPDASTAAPAAPAAAPAPAATSAAPAASAPAPAAAAPAAPAAGATTSPANDNATTAPASGTTGQ